MNTTKQEEDLSSMAMPADIPPLGPAGEPEPETTPQPEPVKAESPPEEPQRPIKRGPGRPKGSGKKRRGVAAKSPSPPVATVPPAAPVAAPPNGAQADDEPVNFTNQYGEFPTAAPQYEGPEIEQVLLGAVIEDNRLCVKLNPTEMMHWQRTVPRAYANRILRGLYKEYQPHLMEIRPGTHYGAEFRLYYASMPELNRF